jgi:hypothetical protein
MVLPQRTQMNSLNEIGALAMTSEYRHGLNDKIVVGTWR